MTDDTRGKYHTTASRVHGVGQIGHEKKLEWLRRLMDDDVSLARAYAEIQKQHVQGSAAASTFEALMFELRQGGIAALKEAPARRRLAALSEAQLREVCGRLQKLNPEIAKPWTAGEIDRLLETWDALHG